MRATLVLLGVGSSGCDIVLGLDRASPALEVSISSASLEIRNDPAGLPVTQDVDVRRVTPTVILDDGSQPEVTSRADGRHTFSRATEGQPYRIVLASDVEYQGATPTLTVQDVAIGRADRGDPRGGIVRQTIPNGVVAPGTTAFFVTTGLWTETSQNVGSGTNQSFTLPWTLAVIPGRFYDSVGTVMSSEHDRAFAVIQTTAIGPRAGYYRVSSACEDPGPFEIGGLVDVDLACSVVPVTDVCERVHAAPAEALALLATTVDPLIYTRQRYGWEITAVPAPDRDPTFGLSLAWQQVETNSGTATVAWDDPVTYGNPFPGHAVGVRTQAALVRQVLAPAAMKDSTLTSDIRTWRAAGAACTNALAPSPVGVLATAASFARIPLAQDAVRIALDRSAVSPLEWTTVGTGNVDYYEVVLHEIAPLFGGTFIAVRRRYVTTQPSITVAPDVFEPGRLYAFSIATHDGYPNAAVGDYATLGYPASPLTISRSWSSTFIVE